MKRVLLLVVAAFAISIGAQAQSNVVKINVLSPIVRTASVFYERTISENKSAQLGLFYTGFSVDDTKFSGFGVTPEFRMYLSKSKQAPTGFYVAPFLRYQSFNLKVENAGTDEFEDVDAKATYSTFGGGLLVGNQWVFADRFVLDTFFGPSYNAGSINVKSGDEEMFETGAFGGFGIRTGVAFGLKF